jgi:hypothetical protein
MGEVEIECLILLVRYRDAIPKCWMKFPEQDGGACGLIEIPKTTAAFNDDC